MPVRADRVVSPLRTEAPRAIVSLDQMVDLEFAERLELPVGGNVEFVPTEAQVRRGISPIFFKIADRVDVVDRHTRVSVRHQSRQTRNVDALHVVRLDVV